MEMWVQMTTTIPGFDYYSSSETFLLSCLPLEAEKMSSSMHTNIYGVFINP